MDNDYELLYLAKEHNEEAMRILKKKYFPMLQFKAFYYGKRTVISKEDLLNEAELSFYNAIDNYQDDYNFSTYLNTILNNSLTNYVNSYNTNHHKILNDAVSLEFASDTEIVSDEYNPEVLYFNNYNYLELRKKIINKLSWKEELVLILREQDFTIKEIAAITDNNLRSVYNIIKRIQNKTIKLMSS